MTFTPRRYLAYLLRAEGRPHLPGLLCLGAIHDGSRGPGTHRGGEVVEAKPQHIEWYSKQGQIISKSPSRSSRRLTNGFLGRHQASRSERPEPFDAAIDLPGASPRARLLAVLKKAFSLFKTIPILQFFTGSDYDLLFRRLPPERLQQHLASDRLFFGGLVARCQEAGIPIQVRPEEMSGLLYALVLGIVHEDDWGASNFGGAIDVLLELVAAFCVGEVVLQVPNSISPTPQPEEGYRQ